jgi:nucleotide-binding universal stress UspA family protein
LSARAVPVAEAIARAQGAEIVLVRVVEPWNSSGLGFESYVASDVYDEMTEALEIAAKQDLAMMVDRIKERGGAARSIAFTGVPGAGLLDAEVSMQPDLVVIASHGRSGLVRFALGSVTERLVREGNAPVLIVQAASPVDRPIDSALVPLDGSPLAELALPMMEALAGKPVRQVRLLRAVGGPDDAAAARDYLDHVANRLRNTGLMITVEVAIAEPTQAIANAAASVDLVVIATHGRGGFDRLRHGSVAEQVTHDVHTPVLLVRATRAVASRAVTPAFAASAG